MKELKPYLREFAALSKMGLFRFLCDKRRENTSKQLDALVRVGIVSSDPHVRAVATAIVQDGSLWQLFDEMATALNESEGRPEVVIPEKRDRDYVVPEFAGDFMPEYAP